MYFLALNAEYIFMFLDCAFNYVTFFGQWNMNGIGSVPVLNLILTNTECSSFPPYSPVVFILCPVH